MSSKKDKKVLVADAQGNVVPETVTPTIFTMRQELLTTIGKMLDDGYDFVNTPPIFEWRYEEKPEILFKLLVKQDAPKQLELGLEPVTAIGETGQAQ